MSFALWFEFPWIFNAFCELKKCATVIFNEISVTKKYRLFVCRNCLYFFMPEKLVKKTRWLMKYILWINIYVFLPEFYGCSEYLGCSINCRLYRLLARSAVEMVCCYFKIINKHCFKLFRRSKNPILCLNFMDLVSNGIATST